MSNIDPIDYVWSFSLTRQSNLFKWENIRLTVAFLADKDYSQKSACPCLLGIPTKTNIELWQACLQSVYFINRYGLSKRFLKANNFYILLKSIVYEYHRSFSGVDILLFTVCFIATWVPLVAAYLPDPPDAIKMRCSEMIFFDLIEKRLCTKYLFATFCKTFPGNIFKKGTRGRGR